MPGLRVSVPDLDRRRLLALAGVGTVAALSGRELLAAASASAATADLDPSPFTLGVASGDPHHDSVVLWTRVVPDPFAADGGMPEGSVQVRWELARDERFRVGRQSGTVTTDAASAHTVHVTVEGLRPDSWHWYRFSVELDGERVSSRTGRTRTLPAPGQRVDQLTFAFASCQSWVGGPYPAWRDLAEQDLDFVVHLGDYIYETSLGSLAEFRRLHALYKTSPDLREAHARFPFVTTWDDHEVQNNYADEVPGAAGDGRPFLERRAAAYQAYFEHLPLRAASEPEGPDMLLYRRFDVGRLARFSVLDTRQYRTDQPCGDGRRVPCAEVDDPAATLTGPEQERWLLDQLSSSRATWNAIAQQTIMAQFDYDLGPDKVVNLDQWDGYPAARSRILGHLAQQQVSNPVVLSGDWHTSWVNDLLADFDDPGSPVLATEFVGTSISSGAGWDADVRLGLPANPHVRFYNGTYRGYVMCSVTPERWRSTYRIVLDARDPDSPAFTLGVFDVTEGTPGAVRVDDGDGLTGAVRDQDGEPVGQAEVVVSRDGTRLATTSTDPQGRWVLFVPAGDCTVTVRAVGYEEAVRDVTVDGSGSATADVTLRRLTGARARTGALVPGPRREAGAGDVVLENGELALAVSAATQDSQLRPVTVGKPLDLAHRGALDQIDWINLPYAQRTQPTGTEAWQSLSVRSSEVGVVTAGGDVAEVETVGVVVGVEQVSVRTRYRLAAGSQDVEVTSTFRNAGTDPVTLWVGDAIDHDGAGQRSGVPGHGTISTPYGSPAVYVPTAPWMGMTGTDQQVYGLLYDEAGFDCYGNSNWIMSRRQVTVPAGGSYVLARRLTVRLALGTDPWQVLDRA
ncbi:alkaline phosphatase D family protein [Auraticoccus cholistanensis]|uniref:alkaline phosphatase D family protein n=1 Tax=Auraticoccus cholistanensis TaxID=2656650 RepID=UPI0018D25C6D|nr:alkaline phosphatase D family protein [Auraticoccus cholistanensis]